MAFLQKWNLKDYPFEDNTNPDYYYQSIYHEEALERMKYIVNSRNMNIGLLTGEIGSGKTITRNKLVDYLREDDKIHYCAIIDTANYNYKDMLMEIVSQITGLDNNEIPKTTYKLTLLLKKFMESKLDCEDYDIIVLVDEIQKISPMVLDSLKDLTNIRYNYKAPVKLLFFGQPDFIPKILRLPQVDQRISMRYHLANLTESETNRFIRHRITVAGGDPRIFSDNACSEIYQQTGGIPREINRAASIAMEYAYAEDHDRIEDVDMSIIFNDIKVANFF